MGECQKYARIREAQDEKTSTHDNLTTEKKKSTKRIAELDAELDQSKKSAQRIFFEIARKDQELKQKVRKPFYWLNITQTQLSPSSL